MAYHWSTHQLTEYFTALIGLDDERTALALAVERAAEALEAEVGATLLNGKIQGAVGLGPDTPMEILAGAGAGEETVEVPGLGLMHATSARLARRDGGDTLIVARLDDAFTAEELQLVQGMAQMLGLALRGIQAVAMERALREAGEREADERLRLLDRVQARQRLLETLLAIQRAISHRRPLQEVLDAVTGGASTLLDDAMVALVVADPVVAGRLIMASTSATPFARDSGEAGASGEAPGATGAVAPAEMVYPGELLTSAGLAMGKDRVNVRPTGADRHGPRCIIAAPVHVAGEVSGSLVAVASGAPERAVEQRDLLAAFAQQVSLALTDAQTLEAVREAYHDALTGLPNRGLFLDQVTQAIGATTRPDTGVTVLFIDLDRFKTVNDSLGHQAGDLLLTAVAKRIGHCLRSDDVAARLGGDEFAVLLKEVTFDAGLDAARRIIDAVRKPFRIAGRDIFIGVSIGLAHEQACRRAAAELLSNADVAMYEAKRNGSGRVEVFTPRMHAAAFDRLNLAADLQQAIGLDEFRLNYQPLVRLDSAWPVGVESLLRWTHPVRGVVGPAAFIPIAEDTGLIVEIGRWVLRESVRQATQWRRDVPDLTININISARQFLDRSFVTDVAETLAEHGLPAEAVTLELTETAFMGDPASASEQMGEIKRLGVGLSIDDFGTGYSSLSYLRRFPVDEVKIDRAFIAGLGVDTADLAIARAVIDLGRTLGLRTVAEGIEDAGQADTLRRLGCDLGQGYHFARPMEPDAVPAYFARHRDPARHRGVARAA